jgi:LmbE family N-acetylglucosaminyl deacetylase
MGTLVCFHAHPDDECINTAGTMAKAAAGGHRVVLVVATGGEYGEVPDDLAEGETLVDRRRAETMRSAALLGVARVVWLGYRDSGMTGWEQNSDPRSFVQADLEEAAGRLSAVLRDEQADVLTVYDFHGNYGHPDHVRVHHVGHRAAELAGTTNVYEATLNRDHVVRLMAAAREAGYDMTPPEGNDSPDSWTDDGLPFGMPEDALTTQVDVAAYIADKRASLECHASQTTDSSYFLSMPEEAFLATFGIEWFIHKGVPPGLREDALVGLD